MKIVDLRCNILIVACISSLCLSAQNFREQYETFRRDMQQEYADFCSLANHEYIDFI